MGGGDGVERDGTRKGRGKAFLPCSSTLECYCHICSSSTSSTGKYDLNLINFIQLILAEDLLSTVHCPKREAAGINKGQRKVHRQSHPNGCWMTQPSEESSQHQLGRSKQWHLVKQLSFWVFFFFFVRGRHEKWVGLIKGSIRKAHTSSRVASPWQGWCPFGRKEENHRITNFLESPVIYWSFVY